MKNVDYTNLIPLIQTHHRDWVIEWCEVTKIYPTVLENQKPRGQKIKVYAELIKSGVIFPPIVVDENYLILDGWHRWLAVIKLGLEKTPVLKSVGEGNSKILKDECFKDGEFILPYKNINREDPDNCLVCKKQLIYAPENSFPGPLPAFPMGMPATPYFYCDVCGIIVNPKLFVVWKSL